MIESAGDWTAIPSWQGYYEADSNGFVRGVDRIIHIDDPLKNRSYNRLQRGITLRPFVRADGYFSLMLWKDGVGYPLLLAPLILSTFVGARPDGCYHACHRDGVKANNAVRNLYWGTPQQNIDDKRVHGTEPRGTQRPNAVLDDDSVREIRRLRGAVTQRALAERFGVAFQTISDVQRRKKWLHVV